VEVVLMAKAKSPPVQDRVMVHVTRMFTASGFWLLCVSVLVFVVKF
jgi:hypothetical protein